MQVNTEWTSDVRDRLSILLVEDEEGLLEILRDSLVSAGVFAHGEILTAENGLQGLEVFQKAHPQIVLTDLQMPKMNGQKMIEAIRALDAEVEIVVMTGFADLDIAIKMFQYNVAEFFSKPFRPEVLCRSVSKIKKQILVRQQNKILTQRLHQAEKLSSIGLLASGIAHEINNPNAYLKGNIEIILKYAERFEEAKAPEVMKEIAVSARAALNGSERITKIISALLHSSRNTGGQRGRVRVSDILNDALTLTQYRTKKHKIELKCPPALRSVEGNATELSQVFMNLIVNAMDAIEERFPDGGQGKLDITVTESLENNRQRIHFLDNGNGISEEYLVKIFDPFFSTKPINKGTGLGLSICKGIVESHNGDLIARSLPEQGAEFVITLPVMEEVV